MHHPCEGPVPDMPLVTSHCAFASHGSLARATCASHTLPVPPPQEPASTPSQRTPVPT